MSQTTATPTVIFFDAVGTLFGVRHSVGHIYGELAQKQGVVVDTTALDQAFYAAFKAAPPMAFPGAAPQAVKQHEFDLWQAIAHQTFAAVGALNQFADFDQFFEELYAHFATAQPWFIYDDTIQTLEYWRTQSISLGIISNFDSRIYPVLRALGLTGYFDSVTISAEVGAAKPSPDIFVAALQKHNCLAHEAWHIGDSRKEDYQGAIAAGLRGIWLRRK